VARATAGDRQSIAQNERQKSAGTTGATAKTRVDACSLLKSDELLAIQGEAIRETKLSESASGSLATQQCLYILQTYSKSLSLSLTQRDSSKGEGVKLKEFWEEKFRAFEEEEEREKGGNKGERSAKEAEREREKKRDAARGESSRQDKERDEEEESKPVRVPGVGEEAFWVGNRMLGALYVFSKNSILRLSLGGPEDEAAKIIKLKALAQKAIKRL
jgi:hypothetical protein